MYCMVSDSVFNHEKYTLLLWFQFLCHWSTTNCTLVTRKLQISAQYKVGQFHEHPSCPAV